eukprot:7231921-Alexandrium_andersonii.AAC.1
MAHVLQFTGGADSDPERAPIEGAPGGSGDEQFPAPRPLPRPASPGASSAAPPAPSRASRCSGTGAECGP